MFVRELDQVTLLSGVDRLLKNCSDLLSFHDSSARNDKEVSKGEMAEREKNIIRESGPLYSVVSIVSWEIAMIFRILL